MKDVIYISNMSLICIDSQKYRRKDFSWISNNVRNAIDIVDILKYFVSLFFLFCLKTNFSANSNGIRVNRSKLRNSIDIVKNREMRYVRKRAKIIREIYVTQRDERRALRKGAREIAE